MVRRGSEEEASLGWRSEHKARKERLDEGPAGRRSTRRPPDPLMKMLLVAAYCPKLHKVWEAPPKGPVLRVVATRVFWRCQWLIRKGAGSLDIVAVFRVNNDPLVVPNAAAASRCWPSCCRETVQPKFLQEHHLVGLSRQDGCPDGHLQLSTAPSGAELELTGRSAALVIASGALFSLHFIILCYDFVVGISYMLNISWKLGITIELLSGRYLFLSCIKLLQIAEDYSHCDLLLRLPGYCPMPAFRDLIDVPLVVRRLRKSRSEVRKELGIGDDVKVLIFNFGGQVSKSH
ncbi:hypothetical protein ZIOFF_069932 [Zingiber officinale]|uniref:Uncharacterized protein n=1 Tax=Zingiber officinale TaxID=94328 RepID=A0A8J5C4H3_ZINOF|nr:hypothetical protein ZIOFF_069932 [Zingiber officinale]